VVFLSPYCDDTSNQGTAISFLSYSLFTNHPIIHCRVILVSLPKIARVLKSGVGL
jgi:hypothetical protein